jgi:hypothetical protein
VDGGFGLKTCPTIRLLSCKNARFRIFTPTLPPTQPPTPRRPFRMLPRRTRC